MAFAASQPPCQQNRAIFSCTLYHGRINGISTKSLGQRIRKLRTDRSLSQDDLAKALGLHRQSVSLLEKGERDLTATELDEQ
ncbi:helix-turn-helix domain-containing protein [Patescibacteria group bacterium]|nr:helix-turn-helix domain-containing protein [Patescibacteria group bacterium]MBU2259614.1 helix-turn-helix domain-containing protein [Patescibacteria group bacterium]